MRQIQKFAIQLIAFGCYSKIKHIIKSTRFQVIICMLFAYQANGGNAKINYESVSPCVAYKEYLARSPWVKSFEYEQSYTIKTNSGFGTADGALQPSGYYLRFPGRSQFSSNFVAYGYSDHEWEYAEQYMSVCYSQKNSKWTNWNAAMNSAAYYELLRMLRLGLASPNSVEWISPTKFKFINDFGEYAGEIVSYENDLPIEVRYRPIKKTGAPVMEGVITYLYNSNATFPPASFVRTFNGISTTNVIHKLLLGVDDNIHEGYSMTNIIPANAIINEVQLLSNRVRYAIEPDGTATLYKYPYNEFEHRSYPFRFGIILGFLLLGASIGWYAIKSRKK